MRVRTPNKYKKMDEIKTVNTDDASHWIVNTVLSWYYFKHTDRHYLFVPRFVYFALVNEFRPREYVHCHWHGSSAETKHKKETLAIRLNSRK